MRFPALSHLAAAALVAPAALSPWACAAGPQTPEDDTAIHDD